MTSSTAHDSQRFYIEIWYWLLALLGIGTIVVFTPVSKAFALVVVFGVAAIKGVLVVRNYMHLKQEHLIFYLIAGLPVLLIIIMLIALLPDIAFHH